MALAERIADFSLRQNKPVREVFKYPVLMACEQLVAKPGELSIEDRKRFIDFYIALTYGKQDNGILHGDVTELESKNEQYWRVYTRRLDRVGRHDISFQDDWNDYSFSVDQPEVILHTIPREEGIRATSEVLSEEGLRGWMEKALEIYKNSKLPFKERMELYYKYKARKDAQGWAA